MNNPKISIVCIYGKQGSKIKDFILNFVNQSFTDIEMILVNNSADDETVGIVCSLAENDDRIRLLSLPGNEDYNFAQNAGLNIASGDYICFFNADDNINFDSVQNLYYENITSVKNNINIQSGRLYKRSFIENNKDIEEIIKNKIDIQKQELSNILSSNEKNMRNELDECYKNSENTINNKIYDLTLRFNFLEKTLYDKEKEIRESSDLTSENAVNIMHKNNEQIYSDISKVYDYINSEINQKGCDINKIYEEITKNYNYTEKLIEETKQAFHTEINNINRKLEEYLKENEIRYNNLQKLIEVTSEELKDKIESVKIVSDDDKGYSAKRIADLINIERTMNVKTEEIYALIEKNSKDFYEELSNLYRELKQK